MSNADRFIQVQLDRVFGESSFRTPGLTALPHVNTFLAINQPSVHFDPDNVKGTLCSVREATGFYIGFVLHDGGSDVCE